MDHEIRADEEADWLEAQALQNDSDPFEDADLQDFREEETVDLYDQSDDELDELIGEWEKNEQAEL